MSSPTKLPRHLWSWLNPRLRLEPLEDRTTPSVRWVDNTPGSAGTEFTASGLLGSDSVASVTLTSPGAAATSTVAGSPYAITPSAAVGVGLANYAITYVDGTLSFRWSCRMGICGSCGMTINGDPKLGCATFLADFLPGPVRVEPMANFEPSIPPPGAVISVYVPGPFHAPNALTLTVAPPVLMTAAPAALLLLW